MTKKKSENICKVMYRRDHCDQIIEHFKRPVYKEMPRVVTRKNGATVEETVRVPNEPPSLATFAAEIGTSYQQLIAWKEKHPDFADACAIAYTLEQKWWEAALVAGLSPPGNTIFAVKNVSRKWADPWHDVQDVRASGDLNITVVDKFEKGKPANTGKESKK